MGKHYTILPLLLAFLGLTAQAAQAQCPGCQIALPELPEDTIYLGDAPNGRVGMAYAEDISFRLPKTTTPVHAADPSVPAGLSISQMTITGVGNLPPGLSWEANQTTFQTASQTDGCVRFCGMPLAAGLYEIEVFISAQVFLITQTTSFTFPLLVEPSVSITEGFSMMGGTGCGQATATFTNNVPSQGQPGFSYQWNFGNGLTSSLENPGPMTYTEPGTYPIGYQAVIDTLGYFLTSVTVLNVTCTDIFSGPDLKLDIFDPEGVLFHITPIVNNANTPLTFQLNIPLDTGTYRIRVVDHDWGIDGPDDYCGTVNFTRHSNGALLFDGPMSLTLTVLNPRDTVRSTDTIRVYAQPTAPTLSGAPAGIVCEGQSVTLLADYSEGLQWYRDGQVLLDETGSILLAEESGSYQVRYTSPEGCIAWSEAVPLVFEPLPATGAFLNVNNLLRVDDPGALPAGALLSWFLDGTLIPNVSGIAFCASQSGYYEVRVTDPATGCSSFYGANVIYNPNFPGCLPLSDTEVQGLSRVYLGPNPTAGLTWLHLELEARQRLTFQIFNAQGQLLAQHTHDLPSGASTVPIDLAAWPGGMYQVVLRSVEGGLHTLRVLKH